MLSSRSKRVPRHIWECGDSLGCHMGGGGGTTSGQRPGMPGDIPQGTGQPPQPRMTQHKCQALNFRSPCAAQLGEPSAPPGTDQVTWWYLGEDCSSPQGPAAFPWCLGRTAERLDSARPPWDSLPRVWSLSRWSLHHWTSYMATRPPRVQAEA